MEKQWSYLERRLETINPDVSSNIFLGDSLINFLNIESYLPFTTNIGISGENTSGALQWLTRLQLPLNANLFFSYGINDIGNKDIKEICNQYKKLLKLYPKNNKFILSLLPVNEEKYLKHWKYSKLNKDINDLNRCLHQIAIKNNTHFLKIDKYLKDGTGQLCHNCDIGDGLHLNKEGNILWIKAILEELANFR